MAGQNKSFKMYLKKVDVDERIKCQSQSCSRKFKNKKKLKKHNVKVDEFISLYKERANSKMTDEYFECVKVVAHFDIEVLNF